MRQRRPSLRSAVRASSVGVERKEMPDSARFVSESKRGELDSITGTAYAVGYFIPQALELCERWTPHGDVHNRHMGVGLLQTLIQNRRLMAP